MTTTPDPNPICLHQFFHADIDVNRETLRVTVNVVCSNCRKPLLFPVPTNPNGVQSIVLQGVWSSQNRIN